MSRSAADLAAELAALRGPGIARVHASARSASKFRAAFAFGEALRVLGWSNSRAARHVGVDESTIRYWLDASKQPAWIPLALPRDGYLAFLDALLRDAPPRTGTDG